MKSLVTTLLILLDVSIATQNQITANYSSQLLRQAKTSELMSYLSNENYKCSSFYEQACGNWRKTYPATLEKTKTSHLGQIHDLYVSKSRDLLKTYEGFDVPHKFVSDFYKSCVNKTQIEKIGIEPILKHLHFNGGWPEIKQLQWYESEYDWLKVVADVRRDLGLNLFIGLALKPGPGLYVNAERIEIGPPKLSLGSRNVYLDEAHADKRTHYKEKIAEELQKHFPNVTAVWCKEVAEQVLQVEISLSEGLADPNKKPNSTQTQGEQTLAQLRTKYATFVDFSRYFSIIFDRTINEQIYEIPGDYFSHLLKFIEQTPKLTIANYTMWRVIDHLGFIPSYKNGRDYEIWCTKKVMKHFPQYVSSLFSNEYKTKTSLINNLFSDIKKALEIKFGQKENFAWMSQKSRHKAPENFGRLMFAAESSADLIKYVESILPAIKNDQFYANLLHILKLETKIQLATNVNEHNFEYTDSFAIVPYYSSAHNEIIVPIEFLQTHFLFDAEYPNSINYGTVGVLLAQQLIHSLINEDSANKWWDNTTEEGFKIRKACFAKQLGQYKYHGKPVDDKDAVMKFMINTGALEIAFDAYTAWLKEAEKNSTSEILPNQFSYGKERLFFLSYAQMFCADYFLLALDKLTELPERLLVNGPLANFKKFADIFQCALHRNMNPRNKCTLL